MNILDQVVSFVSPEKGLERKVARAKLDLLNSGYGKHGASTEKNSMIGWDYWGGSADEDIHRHLPTLRQRSRDNYMGVPIATGAIKTMRTNIVGPGLQLKSQIDGDFLGISDENARKLEQTIEREFQLWAGSTACDMERQETFTDLQQLTMINWLLSGDVFATLPISVRPNMPYDLRILLIEADRISTPEKERDNPNIVGGVETDASGEVVAYHICNIHPLSDQTLQQEKTWNRVEAYGKTTGRQNVIHVMNKERIGQKRGVPFLAPVIETLKQLGRYTESELMATVVSSFFTVLIKKETPKEGSPFAGVIPEMEKLSYNPNPNNIELGPGAIVDLAPGEEPVFADPSRPGSNFDSFVVSVIRQIGAALELPPEILLKQFSASYSASRAALLEFWKMVKMYREWLVNDFCQPIFNEWMAEAVVKGRVVAPGFFSDPILRQAYCNAEWTGPAQGMLNPVHEVKAAQTRMDLGLSTGEREASEINGSSFANNARKRKQEVKIMSELQEEQSGASR